VRYFDPRGTISLSWPESHHTVFSAEITEMGVARSHTEQ
jgi:hypothetical protein